MTRREIREHLFRILFGTGFYDEEEKDEQFELYWDLADEAEPTEEERTEISTKFAGIKDNITVIDSLIEENSRSWKLNRIGNADITILRIAIYEIKWDEKVPTRVAINEAVELAKKYGTDDNSAGFVNGILGSVVKNIGEGL